MKKLLSILLLLITFGCVDRVLFDIKIPDDYTVSIEGFISDQLPPYRIRIYRTFDIESMENLKTGVTARVTLHDNHGNSEELEQLNSGVYENSTRLIQGKVGDIYKIKVELEDGRVYESIPDTLHASGKVDDVRWEFTSRITSDGLKYGFDIFEKSSLSEAKGNVRFMWRNKVTFKAKTKPEAESGQCYYIRTEGRCNFVHPCTGLKNIGTTAKPEIVRVGPCTCCICWYDAYNPQILLDDQVIAPGNSQYPEMQIDRVPLSGWYLQYKMRIEVSIQSLSTQSFRAWKGIRDQYSALNNIFQPITGKIHGNIVQTAGTPAPAQGIFYATSIADKHFYISAADIDPLLIPSIEFRGSGEFPCFDLAPNSTNRQPVFWEE